MSHNSYSLNNVNMSTKAVFCRFKTCPQKSCLSSVAHACVSSGDCVGFAAKSCGTKLTHADSTDLVLGTKSNNGVLLSDLQDYSFGTDPDPKPPPLPCPELPPPA